MVGHTLAQVFPDAPAVDVMAGARYTGLGHGLPGPRAARIVLVLHVEVAVVPCPCFVPALRGIEVGIHVVAVGIAVVEGTVVGIFLVVVFVIDNIGVGGDILNVLRLLALVVGHDYIE